MKKSNKYLTKNKITVLDIIVKFEEIIIFTIGIFITLAIFLQVILRYIFMAPIIGLEEIALLLVSWFYFIGASYSIYTRSYIKADILSLIVKNPRVIKTFNIICFILSTMASLGLFFYGLKYAIWSYKNNLITPHFLVSANFGFGALVVGAFLMTLHFIQLIKEERNRKI